jgi:hypothetical protein
MSQQRSAVAPGVIAFILICTTVQSSAAEIHMALVDDEHPTVLERSLIEGAAEFVAELTSDPKAFLAKSGWRPGMTL